MRQSFYRAALQTNLFVLESWYTSHLDYWWKSIEKHSAYWMKFSSIMAFSLQSYPQPLLIFFCSKQKSFMKCTFITSFSTSVAFHILYIYQLKRLLLKCSFLLFLSKGSIKPRMEEAKGLFSSKRFAHLEL